MKDTTLAQQMKQHVAGFSHLNQLTLQEKRNRLPNLLVEDSGYESLRAGLREVRQSCGVSCLTTKEIDSFS